MSDFSECQGGHVFDLLLIVDATGSAHPFHAALRNSLPGIIRFSIATGAFSRIGVLAYRDYTEQDLLEWSGWCDLTTLPRDDKRSIEKHVEHPRDKRVSHEDLVKFASRLWNRGGKDHAEAVKTALAMAHSVMRAEAATTVTFLYADAPPHLSLFPTKNQKAEMAALTAESYDGFGSRFAEWTSACRTLAGKDGGKRAVVHCIVPDEPKIVAQMLGFLSAVTGGLFFEVPGTSEDAVSRATIGILLAWIGVRDRGERLFARQRFYARPGSHEALTAEEQLLGPNPKRIPEKEEWRLLGQHVTRADLYHIVTRRPTPTPDFVNRYAADGTYRTIVTEQLRATIEIDPETVTLNHVFATLFRTLCGDLSNPARDELVELFSQTAAQMRFSDRKWLKEWLEKSYGFPGEVDARIRDVDERDLFPCVYLDPTQAYTMGKVNGQDSLALDHLTREDLLEIGQSCKPHVLHRLGKVLSLLSYVGKREDLPPHIAEAGPGKFPRIPLALVGKKHKRRFFGSLIHTAVPGTVLMRRPAALLAALSLKMRIRHLRDAADAEMAAYRPFWNTTRAPETWDPDCLNLILDADDDYRRRVREGVTQPVNGPSLLLDEDRRIFGMLVGYVMLEANMRTPLTAHVGWTPENTRLGVGPVAVCRRCKYSRSVTAMAGDSVCGVCLVGSLIDTRESHLGSVPEVGPTCDFRQEDDGATTGTWVECRVAACRAQYVIYSSLARGPPKCFYCRNSLQAPTVQCTKCLNRVIYPEEYRPKDLDLSTWQCVACTSGKETIVDVETTVKQLIGENGRYWLIPNVYVDFALRGRPLYHYARFCPYLSDLGSEVPILPKYTAALVLSGKTIHNTEAVKASLRDIICRRVSPSAARSKKTRGHREDWGGGDVCHHILIQRGCASFE